MNELTKIHECNAEIKRLSALIWEQEKIVKENIKAIKEKSEFKIGDKVIVSEGYKGIVESSHICFVSDICLFADTKDGKIHYRFNKPKKDGSMSRFRQPINDYIITIELV